MSGYPYSAYPEKPVVPYLRTVINMASVITAIQGLPFPAEVKRTGYIIFRNESGNGNLGINNNYCGFQADSGRWPAIFDKSITGVVQKTENGTGKIRLFLAFDSVSDCLSMLLDRVQDHGLYVGGTTRLIWKGQLLNNAATLARAYKKEWAAGSTTAEPSSTEMQDFLSMYGQSTKYFK